jgi:hypothetical protein
MCGQLGLDRRTRVLLCVAGTTDVAIGEDCCWRKGGTSSGTQTVASLRDAGGFLRLKVPHVAYADRNFRIG